MKTKTHNSFVISILKVFAGNPFEALNYKQVASRIGAHDKATREMLQNNILRLAEEGILIEQKRGKYLLNPTYINDDILPKNQLTGTIDMKQTGKAYVIPDNPNTEDIFISSNNTHRALHGDKVKVFLFPQRKNYKPEGQVIEILSRAKTKFVGKIKIYERYAFLIPDNKNVPVHFLIPLEDLNGAKTGEKVLIEMTEWNEFSNDPTGKVIKILGTPGNNNVEMQSILAEYDFPLSFSDHVEAFADKIPGKITKEEIARRKDFRKITTFTIDPEDAKDFDDAISYRQLKNENFEVGVHIADVSFYVKPDDLIDKDAYERATSVYLVDRTIPMLPERLSNELCSLRQGEDKLCFSVVFEMNPKAEVVGKWIGKSVINSDRRFAYEEVQKIIETGEGEFKDEILSVHKLAQILRKERFDSGAINFETKEVRFKLDENAKPIGVYIKEQKEANFLIEEFMLLANKQVAEFIGSQSNKAFVYRVHDEPNVDKLNTFVQFVSKLGYRIKTGSRKSLADSFNKLFDSIRGKAEENIIENISIRTMSKAYYTTENIGHYGLGFKYYTHFTSPIRRYPDLMAHRLLEHYLLSSSSADVKELEDKCKHSSLMEKKAADAERTSIKYKQVEYLSDKIGEIFVGKISGVSKWGIYVEIEENKCEGMIPLTSLDDDYYYLDEDNYQVIGRRYRKQYKLGDIITIKVARIDLAKKQIDFEYVGQNGNDNIKNTFSKTKSIDKKSGAKNMRPSRQKRGRQSEQKKENGNNEENRKSTRGRRK